MADDTFIDGRPEPPPWDEDENIININKARAERDASAPRGTPYGNLMVLSDADAKISTHREYFIKGLISPNEMSAVYGAPGCGKTFWVLYVVRAITHGRSILGKRVHKTNALYLALEGVAGFEKRLKAEIETNEESEGFYYVAQPVNLFNDPKARADVIAAIQGCGAGVLVVDTLNRAIPGGSENDPADMSTFIANLDAIRAATDAHIIVIHHCGKDQAQGMRGHSSLLGATDVVIEIVRDEKSSLRTATVEKAKDDADGEIFSFTLQVKDMGEDVDGDLVTTCVVQEIETPKSAGPSPLKPAERLWLDTIAEFFARDKNIQMVVPEDGMPITACATRDDIREWSKTRGLVGVAHSVAGPGILTSTDRSKFARMLEALKIRGKIGVHKNWIWIV